MLKGVNLLRALYNKTKRLNNLMTHAWTIAILTFVYFTIFLAYRGVAKILGKKLQAPSSSGESMWSETRIALNDEDELKRLF